MINRNHFIDCSDKEQFSFSLTCSDCGFTYRSTPIPITAVKKEEAQPSTDNGLHQEAYSHAFSVAGNEAEKLFKACHLCENTVCNQCAALIGNIYICKRCQKKLITEVYNSTAAGTPHTLIMFNRFVLPVFNNMDYYFDGEQGRRIAFIEDENKGFLISFEENMRCLDLSPESVYLSKDIRHEYKCGNRYIHQRRAVYDRNKKDKGFAFFHMEFTGDDGSQIILPGQINVAEGYAWADDVEPILIKFLTKIDLC